MFDLVFVLCLVAEEASSIILPKSPNFVYDGVGKAILFEKLDHPRCLPHFVYFDLNETEHENEFRDYVATECKRHGVHDRSKRVAPLVWGIGAAIGISTVLSTGMIIGGGVSLYILNERIENLEQILNSHIIQSEKNFAAIQKELDALYEYNNITVRRTRLERVKMGIKDLLSGTIDTEEFGAFLPDEFKQFHSSQQFQSMFHVSVTSCSTQRLNFNVCIDKLVRGNGMLVEVLHNGAFVEDHFSYFANIKEHVIFDTEDGKSAALAPVDYNRCVYEMGNYLCEVLNTETCQIPSGTGCEINVIPAPTNNFTFVRSTAAVDIVATREKRYFINEEVKSVPTSGIFAVKLGKRDIVTVGGQKIVGRVDKDAYIIHADVETKEYAAMSKEYHKARKDLLKGIEEMEKNRVNLTLERSHVLYVVLGVALAFIIVIILTYVCVVCLCKKATITRFVNYGA